MRTTALLLLSGLLIGGLALAAEQPASATAQACTGVRDRAPTGVGETFPANVAQVYCFSELTNVQSKAVHVWYRADREIFRIELPVRAAYWRTWSAKRILPAMKGPWHVEVQDTAGKVLATARFTVE